MNDLQLLLFVLVAFYLWECAHWIRRPGIAFRSWLGGALRLVVPEGALSNRLGGLLLSSPLPGIGAFFASQWPPVILTPGGIAAHGDPLDLRDDIPPVAGVRFRFEEIREIRTRRHQVWINGRRFVAAGSVSGAIALVRFVKKLVDAKPDQRSGMIDDWLRSRLDRGAVAARVAAWRQGIEWLGVFCTAEFLMVALVCAWLIREWSLRDVWPWFGVSLVALNLMATVLFFRAHRRLFPEADDERVQHTTMMLLFPLATIRAPAVLSRPLLEDFHPLAVAVELMNPEAFTTAASKQLRRIRVLMRVAAKEDQPFYQRLDRVMVEFLRAGKVDVDALLAPPVAADPACRSFCPRCGSQFTFESGVCGDCGSVPVEPVAGSSQPPNEAVAAGSSRSISSKR